MALRAYAWRPYRAGLAVLASVLLGWLVGASPAAAACPSAEPSYFGPCGPTFTTPMWGDAAGWTDPSKYSTIQLADVNGDGKDELLGRGDAGLEIWVFDTRVGQWRPQVDANGVRQVLSDFRSPLPSEDTLGWKQPEYYSTIQTADLDGNGPVEVIARFPDGMRAYGYTPPPGRSISIDGGTWKTLTTGGPYPDAWKWTDPQFYLTIRSVIGDQTYVVSHETLGMIEYGWVGGWRYDSETSTLKGCSDPACYTSLEVLPQGSDMSLAAADPGSSLGQTALEFQGNGRGWQRVPVDAGRYLSGPLSNDRGSPDCPLSGNLCYPQIPALYETTRWGDIAEDGAVLPEVMGLAPRAPDRHSRGSKGLGMPARPARQGQPPARRHPPRPAPVTVRAAQPPAASRRGPAGWHRARPDRGAQRAAPGARLDALAPHGDSHARGRRVRAENRPAAARAQVDECAPAPPRPTLGTGPVLRPNGDDRGPRSRQLQAPVRPHPSPCEAQGDRLRHRKTAGSRTTSRLHQPHSGCRCFW